MSLALLIWDFAVLFSSVHIELNPTIFEYEEKKRNIKTATTKLFFVTILGIFVYQNEIFCFFVFVVVVDVCFLFLYSIRFCFVSFSLSIS